MHVKDPVFHVRVRWITKTLYTAHTKKKGSAVLWLLAFRGEGNPNFLCISSGQESYLIFYSNILKRLSRPDVAFMVDWPEGAEMQEKLWGYRQDLEKTVGFVVATGLQI